MLERSEVVWGKTTIVYSIRRSPRRGTVAIAVDPSEGVIVTAPQGTPVPRLDGVVREKASWIVQRLRRQSDRPPPFAREFVSGETFLYLGRQYRLRVEPESDDPGALVLKNGWMQVRLPRGLLEAHRAPCVRAALIDWYRRRAGDRIPEIVATWAAQIGVPAPKVLIRGQKKRWASCKRGGIVRFNWRILQAPASLLGYVVAHELVHLVQDDHGREFWALLGRVMPDYEVRRARLRELGPRLSW